MVGCGTGTPGQKLAGGQADQCPEWYCNSIGSTDHEDDQECRECEIPDGSWNDRSSERCPDEDVPGRAEPRRCVSEHSAASSSVTIVRCVNRSCTGRLPCHRPRRELWRSDVLRPFGPGSPGRSRGAGSGSGCGRRSRAPALDLATAAGDAVDELVGVAECRVVVLAHPPADAAELELDDLPHDRVGDRVDRGRRSAGPGRPA